jgi:hypothetical protein
MQSISGHASPNTLQLRDRTTLVHALDIAVSQSTMLRLHTQLIVSRTHMLSFRQAQRKRK